MNKSGKEGLYFVWAKNLGDIWSDRTTTFGYHCYVKESLVEVYRLCFPKNNYTLYENTPSKVLNLCDFQHENINSFELNSMCAEELWEPTK